MATFVLETYELFQATTYHDHIGQWDAMCSLPIEVFPGLDGVVRSVKLKMSNGELSRRSSFLCLLEVAD